MSAKPLGRLKFLAAIGCFIAASAQATPPRPTFAEPVALSPLPGSIAETVFAFHHAERPHVTRRPQWNDANAWIAADYAAMSAAAWRIQHEDVTIDLNTITQIMTTTTVATIRATEAGVDQLVFLLDVGDKAQFLADDETLTTTMAPASADYVLATVALPAPLTPETDWQIKATRVVTLNCEAGFLGFKPCGFGADFTWVTSGVLLGQANVDHEPIAYDLHIVTSAKLVAAAPGVPQGVGELPDGRKIWHFHQADRTEGCGFSIGPYLPLDVPAQPGQPPMRIALAGKYAETAQDYAGLMHDVIGFYGGWFAPFPWQQLNLSQLEDDFGGGESFAAGIFANKSVFWPAPDDMAWLGTAELLAHEMAHQWWGNGVQPQSSGDVALSESFAEFSAALFVEQKLQTRHLILMDNLQYTFGVDPKTDAALGTTSVFYTAAYTDIVYHKGAVVLDMLRRELTDPVMTKAIHAWVEQYGHDFATIADLRKVMETSSGRDLTWFFTQWFNKKGLIRAEVAARLVQTDGAWHAHLRFKQGTDKKRFTIQVLAWFPGGESQALTAEVIPDKAGMAMVDLTLSKLPIRIRLDAERFLLRQFLTGTPGDVTLDGLVDGGDFIDAALRVGRGVSITGKSGKTHFFPDMGFNELYDLTADLRVTAEDLDVVETWLGTEADAF